MRKLIFIFTLLAASACSADYSTPLENGYIYNHWGNNFISHKQGEEERQVIKGQVEDYQVINGLLLASQEPIEAENSQWYWIIDMNSGKKEKYKSYNDFIAKAATYGISQTKVKKLSN